MIETLAHYIVIYIDHLATIFIVHQTLLNTIFIEKLNLRLIRVSKYL